MTRRRAVFLDRDGTINVRPPPHDYVRRAADFRWLPGAACAMARLTEADRALFVVSNQRGVARGLVDRSVLEEIEAIIQRRLDSLGGRVEEFRYCTHELEEGCGCRKPLPGMLLDLAGRHALDLEQSWMIGDSTSDVAAGAAAGCRTCLIDGRGQNGETLWSPTLADAADRILDYETKALSKL
jgi:D-glycero-D-manno-heptose 1,7-bisphosphate phosphatase